MKRQIHFECDSNLINQYITELMDVFDTTEAETIDLAANRLHISFDSKLSEAECRTALCEWLKSHPQVALSMQMSLTILEVESQTSEQVAAIPQELIDECNFSPYIEDALAYAIKYLPQVGCGCSLCLSHNGMKCPKLNANS